MTLQPLLCPRSLRRHPPARSILTWLLLAVLVVGAVSYSQGSRYSLVAGRGLPAAAVAVSGGSPVLAVHNRAALPHSQFPQAAARIQGREDSQAVHCQDPAPGPGNCCKRYLASRGEPSPLRTAALDPPQAAPQASPGTAADSPPSSTERGSTALTLAQLSISRT
ncbi:UNVERIFIED_ORG: hypothetical protein J2X79_004661 [Arthrobacter globiformis]|nr:hypothetical protein [Arthrobacter globiformis]